MTPLTMAAAEGHANIVKYLLDKGADVDGKFTTKKYRWEDSTGTWNVSIFTDVEYNAYSHCTLNNCCVVNLS